MREKFDKSYNYKNKHKMNKLHKPMVCTSRIGCVRSKAQILSTSTWNCSSWGWDDDNEEEWKLVAEVWEGDWADEDEQKVLRSLTATLRLVGDDEIIVVVVVGDDFDGLRPPAKDSFITGLLFAFGDPSFGGFVCAISITGRSAPFDVEGTCSAIFKNWSLFSICTIRRRAARRSPAILKNGLVRTFIKKAVQMCLDCHKSQDWMFEKEAGQGV